MIILIILIIKIIIIKIKNTVSEITPGCGKSDPRAKA
jgi:hypothetical protein